MQATVVILVIIYPHFGLSKNCRTRLVVNRPVFFRTGESLSLKDSFAIKRESPYHVSIHILAYSLLGYLNLIFWLILDSF